MSGCPCLADSEGVDVPGVRRLGNYRIAQRTLRHSEALRLVRGYLYFLKGARLRGSHEFNQQTLDLVSSLSHPNLPSARATSAVPLPFCRYSRLFALAQCA